MNSAFKVWHNGVWISQAQFVCAIARELRGSSQLSQYYSPPLKKHCAHQEASHLLSECVPQSSPTPVRHVFSPVLFVLFCLHGYSLC